MKIHSNNPETTSPACQCGVGNSARQCGFQKRAPRVNAVLNPAFTGRARPCPLPHRGRAGWGQSPRRLPTTGYQLPAAAFTLIELITVIVIIMLLTSILLPTIMKAKQLAYLATTKAYITQLESGALRYQQEKQCFPGQDIASSLGSGSTEYSASQVLGACLFGVDLVGSGKIDFYKDSSNNNLPPTSEYVQYKEDRVVNSYNESDPVNKTDPWSFAPRDLFPSNDSFALLYYPSRLGNNASINDAFKLADNQSITTSDTQAGYNFLGVVWDKRFGTGASTSNKTTWGDLVPNTNNKAYNADTFLLFGKEIDNRDQHYSWFTPKSPKNF